MNEVEVVLKAGVVSGVSEGGATRCLTEARVPSFNREKGYIL